MQQTDPLLPTPPATSPTADPVTPDPGRRTTLAKLAWVPPAMVVLTLTPRVSAGS